MNTIRNKIPWGLIIGGLGLFSTLLGIVAYFFGDFRTLTGQNSGGLSEQQIVATLSSLQSQKDLAELQLTQFALQDIAAANEGTRQANDQAIANFQATLNAVQSQQDAVVATQNAAAAEVAAQEAANATGTQVALDAGATQAAIAGVLPTPSPEPPPTQPPAFVADYRSLTGADIRFTNQGLEFSVNTAENVPDAPTGVSYVWLLDTDRNPATGQPVQDIGVDLRVAIKFDNGAWIGTARAISADGSEGEPLYFVDIKVNGPNASATLDAGQLGIPFSFDWLARSEGETEVYPFFPQAGHVTLQ